MKVLTLNSNKYDSALFAGATVLTPTKYEVGPATAVEKREWIKKSSNLGTLKDYDMIGLVEYRGVLLALIASKFRDSNLDGLDSFDLRRVNIDRTLASKDIMTIDSDSDTIGKFKWNYDGTGIDTLPSMAPRKIYIPENRDELYDFIESKLV